MRRLLIVFAILTFATAAFAAPQVNMTFNTAAGSQSRGSFYTYPYHFTVTPGGSESLMCVDYGNEITR